MDKKIKRIVFKNLNNIYSKSVSMSKQFDQKAISPVILKDVITLSKLKVTKENKTLHDYIKKHNSMLDTLELNCITYMKRIDAEKVSFAYLKMSIDVLKKEITKL